jgi:transcription elongation factor Elf1
MASKRYECPRCGLSTDFRQDYIQHLRRKQPCPALNSDVSIQDIIAELEKKNEEKAFQCEFCGKKLSTRPSLSVHRKNCKMKASTEREPSQAININIKGDHNTVSINNYHIHINPPDYAQTSFLSYDALQKLVAFARNPGQVDMAIVKLVKMIYCNRDHPENYGIYIPNKKRNEALVWDGSRWELQSTKDAVKLLRNKAYCLIGDFYDENSCSFKMMTQQEWNSFINRQKVGEPTVFKKVDKEIGLAILNHTPDVKEYIKGKALYSDTSLWERE